MISDPGVRFREVQTNGIRMRIAEAGEGPLVLLAHGWPETWRSWRHQLTGLAAEGYHVVAPEMRGYGGTDKPAAVEAYDLRELSADLAGLVEALGADKAHLAGHDWGSMVVAGAALLHPDHWASLTLMSVPFVARTPVPPLQLFRQLFGENFFYILYHNEPGGVAEAEYDADPRGLLSRLYLSPDSPRADPEVVDPHRDAGGFIPRIGASLGLPDWLTQADLDWLVEYFRECGFRGGVNYYRNFDRNWEILEPFQDKLIEVPTRFLSGAQDPVIGEDSGEQLRTKMNATIADLREVLLVPGVGHWVQQEAPRETTELLLRSIRE